MSANSGAIGLAKHELETPALCLDLDAYRRNVDRMATVLRAARVAWRPHMKGQKAPQLATLALEAGAIGVTCATLYEAEAMADAGVESILLAHETVGARKQRRLARLAGRCGLISATDSHAHLAQLGEAARAEGVTSPVLIELNVGMNRCGIEPGESAIDLVSAAVVTPGIRLAGLMGWEGHAVKEPGEDKSAKIAAAMSALVETAERCRAEGFEIAIVSAAGSGTFLDATRTAGITEVQAGGGVFSDLNYRKWGLTDHEFALTVVTRVASRPTPTRIIVDAGFKTMSVQHGLPQPLIGAPVRSVVLSAEHGTIELESPDDSLRVGDVVEFVPGYTDSTVCLHDEMCALRGGLLEAVWRIPGRTGR